jgi:hypothetical protein
MKCDSWASFLAHTFTNPHLDREHKARVITTMVHKYPYIFYFGCKYINPYFYTSKLPRVNEQVWN